MSRSRTEILICAAILSLPTALLIFGFWLVYAGGSRMQYAWQTLNWPSVPGSITVSNVRKEVVRPRNVMAEERIEWWADLEYQYDVRGNRYVGHRVAIGQAGVDDRGEAVARLKPYPVGRQVTVYYDPQKPSDACLESGAGFSAYLLLIAGLVVVVLSVRMLLSWLREFGITGNFREQDAAAPEEPGETV